MTLRQLTETELLQIQQFMLDTYGKKLGFGLGKNSTEIFIIEEKKDKWGMDKGRKILQKIRESMSNESKM